MLLSPYVKFMCPATSSSLADAAAQTAKTILFLVLDQLTGCRRPGISFLHTNLYTNRERTVMECSRRKCMGTVRMGSLLSPATRIHSTRTVWFYWEHSVPTYFLSIVAALVPNPIFLKLASCQGSHSSLAVRFQLCCITVECFLQHRIDYSKTHVQEAPKKHMVIHAPVICWMPAKLFTSDDAIEARALHVYRNTPMAIYS